jgi:DnaJ-class molecular chaperone
MSDQTMSGRWEDCGDCHGYGSDDCAYCQTCGGRGEVWVEDEEDEDDDEG